MSVKEFEKLTKEDKRGVKSPIDPQDLMSLKELCLKHGYNYDYCNFFHFNIPIIFNYSTIQLAQA